MAQQQVQPIFILPEGTQRSQGRTAQRNNIAAAKLVAETVRTTLGPKGMDKMIVDSLGDITITNDGVTILEEMQIEHPAAKMIVEVAKTQEQEVGDGTTTAVVFAGELLKNAEDLLDQEVHPSIINRGFRLASIKAHEILEKIGEPVSVKDTQVLKNIAKTAMTGKVAEHAKEILADIVVTAVKDVAVERDGKMFLDTEEIKIERKVGGAVENSQLIRGIVLDKEKLHNEMPRQVKNAKIALVNCAVEIKNTETDAKIQITSPDQLQGFLEQEEKMLRNMVDKIINSGANVVFCQKGIDDIAQHFLAKAGIYAARRIKKSDIDKLARATGAKIASNIDDLSSSDLGHAGLVEEKNFGDEEMTYVTDCKNPKSVTILIKAGTEHVADEVKRAMEDSIGDLRCALEDSKVVAGAGATEIETSRLLMKYAASVGGKEQLAVEAFAKALEVIPRTLAESAGLDTIDKMAELKAAHDRGQKWAGIDVFTGKIRDSWKANVIEPLRVKTQAISSASEAAIMILRIDDVIAGSSSRGPQMPPGGMPDMGGMGM